MDKNNLLLDKINLFFDNENNKTILIKGSRGISLELIVPFL